MEYLGGGSALDLVSYSLEIKHVFCEGELECWFVEGGCKESSVMGSGSGRDCWQSGVKPATLVYGDETGSKLD